MANTVIIRKATAITKINSPVVQITKAGLKAGLFYWLKNKHPPPYRGIFFIIFLRRRQSGAA